MKKKCQVLCVPVINAASHVHRAFDSAVFIISAGLGTLYVLLATGIDALCTPISITKLINESLLEINSSLMIPKFMSFMNQLSFYRL